MEKWIVIYDEYKGYTARAASIVVSAISNAVGYCLPVYSYRQVNEKLLAENNLVWIATGKNEGSKLFFDKGLLQENSTAQGYTLKVCESLFNKEKQMALINGNDDVGTLYGAVDFQNKYVGEGAYASDKYQITTAKFFGVPFREKMPAYSAVEAPAFEERGIWTWGYCIYDYKKFFDNMLSLKLNLAVIWNDYPPVNAKEVVAYAHSLGIKIVWGFSWGWDNKRVGFKIDDDEVIDEWTEKIIATYERDYLDTGADGIYFQSFTETYNDNIGGISIAEAVVKWVNRIGKALLEKYPDLKLQFGLHAMSVKQKLQYIAQVDERIAIVWEDCGSFPYHYRPQNVSDYKETQIFTDKICALRGEEEKFGAVLKGMTTLDWLTFEHYSGPYILGEQSQNFIKDRTAQKNKWWKYLQAYWLENAEYAYDTVKQIQALTKGKGIMQMLVEDGCFEESVFFPAALCAEMLWNTTSTKEKIVRQVALFPQVKFANN